MSEDKSISIKGFGSILKQTAKEWMDDEPFTLAAALSYYAIISLPAVLLIVVVTAGTFYGQEAVTGTLSEEMASTIGPKAAETVENMIAEAQLSGNNTWKIIISIGMLLFSATGVFFQLQQALNKVWEVKERADVSWTKLLKDRANSLGIVLSIGLILIVSLVISAILSTLTGWITSNLGPNMDIILPIANFLLSVGVLTLMFALMYKVLPDVEIEWKDVWVGAFFTASLFTVSKTLLGYYFSVSDPASSYGAAGSLVLIMLWVSYTCLVILFGAEFTQVYARRYGDRIRPSAHAYRYKIVEETIEIGKSPEEIDEEKRKSDNNEKEQSTELTA